MSITLTVLVIMILIFLLGVTMGYQMGKYTHEDESDE